MAVMFADISESTSLYQKLGDAAARNIVNACLTLITGTLARFNGRLVKTIGDEVMCVFPSADLAVLAASDMQAQVATSRPGNHPVSIHVGLHYGPVLVEEGDVFGDTVNVAAYLAAVAAADQILVGVVAAAGGGDGAEQRRRVLARVPLAGLEARQHRARA